MPAIHPELLHGLQEGLFFTLCAGLACSALWGFWLLLAPAMAQRFAAGADQWVATAAMFDRLNRPVETTRWFYRHHLATGVMIAAGSGYALWRWFSAYEREAVLGLLDPALVRAGMDWLVPALASMFVAFSALTLVVGLVIAVRPSLLKTPERFVNQWVRVPADRTLDRRSDPLARLVVAYPRVVGLLVAALCSGLFWRLLNL